MPRFAASLLLALASLFFAACGGGGGGAPGGGASGTAAPAPAGEYFATQFARTMSLPFDRHLTSGTASPADGGGLTFWSERQNLNGAATPVPSTTDFLGVTAPDGLVTLNDGLRTYLGRYTADGALGVFQGIGAGNAPGLLLLARREPGLATADIHGIYHIGTLVADGASVTSVFGRYHFDGLGAFTGALAANVEGGFLSMPSIAGTYGVDPDGRMWLRYDGGDFVRVGPTRGGDVLLGASGLEDGNSPGVFVAVRAGTTRSLAGLAGSWHTMGLGRDPRSGQVLIANGSVDVAGDATGRWWASFREPGGVVVATWAPMTVAVDGFGQVDMTLDTSRYVRSGALGERGDFVFVTANPVASQLPALWFQIR